MSGDIPSGQTVTIDGKYTSVSDNQISAVTDYGTLNLAAAANGFALIQGGALTVGSGGVLTTSGTANNVYLRSNITNDAGGTVTIGSPNTLMDANTSMTNDGSFTVSSGGALNLSTGSDAFTNAGTLTLTGTLSSQGAFTQTSGSISGNPVNLYAGSLADTAGTGAFDVTGSINMSGDIPSGQTVTIDGKTTSVSDNLTSPLTDSGTLNLAAEANGYALVDGDPLTVASGGVLTTSGTAS